MNLAPGEFGGRNGDSHRRGAEWSVWGMCLDTASGLARSTRLLVLAACCAMVCSVCGYRNAAAQTSVRGSDQSPLRVIRSTAQAEAAAAAAPVPQKIKRYAETLVRRYDADGDLVLQRNEWAKMAGTPRLADTDEDGMITAEELVARIRSYSRGRSLRLMPTPVPSPVALGDEARAVGEDAVAAEGADAADGAERPVRRFFVAEGRRPDGIPEWFVNRDADGDGQLTMAEFSKLLSVAEARQFLEIDANADGLITAEEWIASEKAFAQDSASDDERDTQPKRGDESRANRNPMPE